MMRNLVIAMALAGFSSASLSAPKAGVFPVKGIFYNSKDTQAFHPEVVKTLSEPSFIGWAADHGKKTLDSAFIGRTSVLTNKSASSVFAVSLQLTRASVHTSPKADGNIEVRIPITGSVYFTNIATGEIIFSETRTHASTAALSTLERQGSTWNDISRKLIEQAIAGLIEELSISSAAKFEPKRIEARVDAITNGLIRFKIGFKSGLQKGDSLEDEQGNLIRVVYTSEGYSYAKPVIAGPIKNGDVFGKYVVGPIDGQQRPRIAVIASAVPAGFSDQYLAQILGEEIGKKAPATVVQINPTFSSLVSTVAQQADLSSKNFGQRSMPELLIKLSVPEPYQFESKTNLNFKTLRTIQASAYAWVTDVSGRVIAVVEGSDMQQVEVVKDLDLDPLARREIGVKNALLDLSEKLKGALTATTKKLPIETVDDLTMTLSTSAGLVFDKTSGVVLKKAGFGSTPLPNFDAQAIASTQSTAAQARLILPIAEPPIAIEKGDQFEYREAGKTPGSANTFSICPNAESLGNTTLPQIGDIVATALANQMPGVFFDNSVSAKAKDLLNQATGFSENFRAAEISTQFCIQPVQRLDRGTEVCGQTCQLDGVARLTLRTVSGNQILDKKGLQVNFKSSGYWPGTEPASAQKLFEKELAEEVRKLASGISQKISF